MRSGIFLPPLLLAQAVWFLAPGLLAGLTLLRRRLIPAYYVVPVAILVGCLVGYLAFWVYFGSIRAGWAYSAATIAAALGSTVLIAVRPGHRHALRTLDIAGPLVLLYLVTLVYSSLTFSCAVTANVVDSNQLCHIHGLTGDNQLPQIFADNIYHGTPKAITWTWLGSDRPPLQAGAVLLQTPLTQAAGWHISSYVPLAILMQVFWVPAVWTLGRSLGLHGRRLAVLLVLCLFSGFMLYNSVFTWPKLLAASLALTAFGLLFFEKVTTVTGALAGAAVGVALMAHPGVLFTLIPMVAVLLLRRWRPGVRPLLVAAAVVLVIMAPWQMYQKFYDPPGNRLLKWHLAGVIAVDDRSVTQAIYDAYTRTPPATIAGNKLVNLGTVVGYQTRRFHLAGTGYPADLRDEEFRYVLFSLGLFNLGWFVLLFRRARERLREAVDLDRVRLMLTVAGAATLLWTVLIFLPRETVTFQNSYATMLLLIVACGAVVTAFPRTVIRLLVAVQLAYFAVIWVLTVWLHQHLHPSYIALTLAGGAALLAYLELVARRTAADRGPVEPPSVSSRVGQPTSSSARSGSAASLAAGPAPAGSASAGSVP